MDCRSFSGGFRRLSVLFGAVAEFLLSHGSASSARRAGNVQHVSFVVRGMYCPACAKGVETKLMNLSGVKKAQVSYEQRRAEIEYDGGAVSVDQMEKAIQQAGYQAQKM